MENEVVFVNFMLIIRYKMLFNHAMSFIYAQQRGNNTPRSI